MVSIFSLWLPILLSAVAVFIVSSLIHMFTPWHKNDFSKLPDEEKVMDMLRPFTIPPGEYMVPKASSTKEVRSPEFKEKYEKGPVMILNVFPKRPMSMTKNLVQWFIYSVIVGIFAGYVTSRAVTAGAEYLYVFRFAGVTAFLSYGVALWQMSVWYNRPWSLTLKITIDGLIYGIITAAIFGWLWPAM
ncbi:MAG: hypothetical protein ACYDA4_12550 [Ignavibacteriaceae bacterium]